jgi:hypothetical protein
VNPEKPELLTTSAEHAKFSRIYFDSSLLLKHQWPLPSSSLRNLLLVAHSIEIPCLIPEPVLVELEEGWMRAFADAKRKFQQHLNTVIENSQLIEDRGALNAYREQVTKLAKTLHLSTVRFTSRPLDQIFTMLSRRDAPFSVVSGFRDGVIQLSIQEDLAKHAEEVAAVISDDGPFHTQCKLLVARDGVKIEQFNDLAVLRKALDAKLDKIAAATMEEDRARLKSAIQEEKTWKDVREFIVQNLRVKVGPSIKEIKGIGQIRLKNVEAPYPPKRKENQSVEVSLEVEVPLLVTALRYVSEPEIDERPNLKIGDRNPEASAGGSFFDSNVVIIPGRSGTVTEEDESQPIDLRIQASAIFEKGHYKDVRLIKLDWSTPKYQWTSPTVPLLSNLHIVDNVTRIDD